MTDLIIDPNRLEKYKDATGIYIRARHVKVRDGIETRGGGWEAVDIACLTQESLWRWLRSRGGANRWAESVVFTLLNHEPMADGGGFPFSDMTNTEQFTHGLNIIQSIDRDGFLLAADHDVIWAGDLEKFSDEQKVELEKFGWLPDDVGRFRFFV